MLVSKRWLVCWLQVSFQSGDTGGHLLGVEDLLQKHSLVELQVTVAMGETVRRLTRQGQQYVTQGHKEAPLLQSRLDQLNTAYTKYVCGVTLGQQIVVFTQSQLS